MTGLDLSAVEKVLREWSIDELRIDRDGGVSDDVLDDDTLLLTPNAGVRVWTGLGAVQSLAGFIDAGDPDVSRIIDETGARYRALLPLREPTGARLGDVLTVDVVHSPSGDPRLADRSFSIVHLGGTSSFAVASIIYLLPVPFVAPGDPGLPGPDGLIRGWGPPPADLVYPDGVRYLDLATGDIYEASNP